MINPKELRIGNIVTIKQIKKWEGRRDPNEFTAEVVGVAYSYIHVRPANPPNIDRLIPEEAFAVEINDLGERGTRN